MTDNKDRPSVEIVAVTQEMKAKISESATKKGSLKAEEKDDDLRAELKMDEHKIPLDELLARYETDVERGLTHSLRALFQDDLKRRLAFSTCCFGLGQFYVLLDMD